MIMLTHQARPGPADARAVSWAAGAVLVGLTAALFTCLVPGLRHWFVLPVTACGVLVAPDAVDWARKRLDTLDPQAVVALLGVHFIFLAPLLHVTLDYWPRYIPPVADWRSALGRMALVNLTGLLIYRAVLAPPDRPAGRPFPQVDRRRLLLLGTLVCCVSLVSFIVLLTRFGGLGGYVDFMLSPDRDLTGFGVTFLVTSTFALVGFTVAVVYWAEQLRRRPWLLLVPLAVFVLALLVAGGLRGSRSGLIWPVLIAIGIGHLVIMPMRRRTMAVSLLIILGFMYLYGFYKSAGASALDLLTGEATIEGMTEETGRDLPGLLLGDLGRADIQALTLERQQEGLVGLGWGVTYLGDLTALLPDGLGLAVPDKVAVGTDLTYGAGTYESGFRSSRIYGLSGEAVLNFGVPGAILSFAVFGFVVRLARRLHREALGAGASIGLKVLASALSITVLLGLSSDFDNMLWFLVNNVLALSVIVFLSRSAPGSG